MYCIANVFLYRSLCLCFLHYSQIICWFMDIATLFFIFVFLLAFRKDCGNWGNTCSVKHVQCASRGPLPVVIQSGIDLLTNETKLRLFINIYIYIVGYHKTDLHKSIIALCLYLTCIFVQTRLCKIYLKFQ